MSDDNHNYANPEELAFLKTQIGIQDDAALKAHVLAVQKKAAAVHNYPCIQRFGFIKIKINKFPSAYQHVLDLGRTVPGALLLDIGRERPAQNRQRRFPRAKLIASDLRQAFWDFGHELFRTTPILPRGLPRGDAFDPEFLALQPLLSQPLTSPSPDLHALTSLTPLHGRLSAIHSASLFHLFSEAGQLELARKLAALLVPRKESIIFGCHGAQPEKGSVLGAGGKQMFCHSPESWAEVWDGEVFERGTVRVETTMVNAGRILNESTDFWMLFWSVERL
ncbi:hypothetical protein K438DRAFT_1962864 [Mycena galopus ATCC 62051]|nr:hypothetical protein K438DRAFT_1962864 [Mycena galopus ATCC 62051]